MTKTRLISESIEYDANSNIIKKITPAGDELTFTYNTLNRLTNIRYSDERNVSYTDDSEGRRLSMTDETGTSLYAYDQLDRLLAYQQAGITTVYYTYDEYDQLPR